MHCIQISYQFAYHINPYEFHMLIWHWYLHVCLCVSHCQCHINFKLENALNSKLFCICWFEWEKIPDFCNNRPGTLTRSHSLRWDALTHAIHFNLSSQRFWHYRYRYWKFIVKVKIKYSGRLTFPLKIIRLSFFTKFTKNKLPTTWSYWMKYWKCRINIPIALTESDAQLMVY